MMIRPTNVAPGSAACVLRVRLDRQFDLAALRGLRRLISAAEAVSRLELDFAAVEWIDGAALRLLGSDLGELEASGVHVLARRLPDAFEPRLRHHPIRRFTTVDDEIFTDPDRDRPGFLPSGR